LSKNKTKQQQQQPTVCCVRLFITGTLWLKLARKFSCIPPGTSGPRQIGFEAHHPLIKPLCAVLRFLSTHLFSNSHNLWDLPPCSLQSKST